GALICLCSKNVPADVHEVFNRRTDMVLRREAIVSERINWQPKSENVRSLADELGLSLDDFVMLDDEPTECAEVRAACPEELTLQIPADTRRMDGFLRSVWAFDRWSLRQQSASRTAYYRQEKKRVLLQETSSDL